MLSSQTYTDEAISHIGISGYVTDEELEAAKAELDGKIALKADEADLQVVSGAVDTNSGNIQTLSGDVDALKLDITHKAEQSVVDTISGNLDTHIADSTIHVTAADKTAWNAKAEVSDIPTDNAQLTNGAGYQTAQDVQNAISGKAETSYVDEELSSKQDIIDENNPLDAHSVSTELNPWPYGDPEFRVDDAINIVHEEALNAQADAAQANADIQIVSGALDGKLDNPSGGTAGQVLTKTADGAEWADAQGGVDNTDYLTFTAEQANSTIALNKSRDSSSLSAVLEYSTDGETWINYEWSGTSGLVITLANVGDFVKFRGDNKTFSIGGTTHYVFKMNGLIGASGNIMTLLSKDGKGELTEYCFNSLFDNCRVLTKSPRLPATRIPAYCYQYMFSSCDQYLEIPPELPATSLGRLCYYGMFFNCQKLKNAPFLPPAKQEGTGAYSGMFIDCTSLSGAYIPDLGPLQYESSKSNGLFENMYSRCTSLTDVKFPDIDFKYLIDCAHNVFNGCSNLNSVTVGFKSWNVGTYSDPTTYNWLNNVAASGTFYCPYGLDTSIRDKDHIPEGWNVVYTDVPESVVSGAAAAAEALTMING